MTQSKPNMHVRVSNTLSVSSHPSALQAIVSWRCSSEAGPSRGTWIYLQRPGIMEDGSQASIMANNLLRWGFLAQQYGWPRALLSAPAHADGCSLTQSPAARGICPPKQSNAEALWIPAGAVPYQPRPTHSPIQNGVFAQTRHRYTLLWRDINEKLHNIFCANSYIRIEIRSVSLGVYFRLCDRPNGMKALLWRFSQSCTMGALCRLPWNQRKCDSHFTAILNLMVDLFHHWKGGIMGSSCLHLNAACSLTR